MINLDLRSRAYPSLLVMKMWDPYLIVTCSLKSAVESYCPNIKENKDVFPHKYINRVGPVAAIGDNELKEIDIEADFYSDKDKKIIRERIKNGELSVGSKAGTVLMPLRKHLFKYGGLDVYALEQLIIALD